MKTIQWSDRRQCLFVYHQNGSLKLQSIQKNISVNCFIQENTEEDITKMLSELPDKNIKYREWQKEDINYQGSIIKKLKLKQLEVTKADFSERFEEDFKDLRNRVQCVNNQHEELD